MSLNGSQQPELGTRVRTHVASGMFGLASDVIRESLRIFESNQSLLVTLCITTELRQTNFSK